MQELKKKIASGKKPLHFLTYCASFIGMGCIITGLGPLIPYLSQFSGRDQTQYSLLFLGRSIGFIIGGLTMKWMEKYFNFHQILAFSCVSTFLFLMGFSFTTDIYFQSFYIMMVSITMCWKGIVINISLLQIQKNSEQQFWILFSQGIFGIGGLVGPILVYLFQNYCFVLVGFWICGISLIYWKLQTPENHIQITQKVNNQSFLEEISGSGLPQPVQPPAKLIQSKHKFLTYEMQMIVCLMFFLYVGIQTSFGGWISPYAVLQNVSTKQQATKFSSFFWLSITIFRFITSFINRKTSQKFNFLVISFIGSCLVIVVLVNLQYIYLGCILSSFLFGICMSCFYALILTLPSEFNIQLTAKQNGIFMIFASFGQGILSMLVGYLMAWIQLNMLFYMILFSGIVLKVSLNLFITSAKKIAKQQIDQNSLQLQLIQKEKLKMSS